MPVLLSELPILSNSLGCQIIAHALLIVYAKQTMSKGKDQGSRTVLQGVLGARNHTCNIFSQSLGTIYAGWTFVAWNSIEDLEAELIVLVHETLLLFFECFGSAIIPPSLEK